MRDGVPGQRPGPEQVCLWPAGSVWILAFVQERFHNWSPGDFVSTCITVGTVKQARAQDRRSNRRV